MAATEAPKFNCTLCNASFLLSENTSRHAVTEKDTDGTVIAFCPKHEKELWEWAAKEGMALPSAKNPIAMLACWIQKKAGCPKKGCEVKAADWGKTHTACESCFPKWSKDRESLLTFLLGTDWKQQLEKAIETLKKAEPERLRKLDDVAINKGEKSVAKDTANKEETAEATGGFKQAVKQVYSTVSGDVKDTTAMAAAGAAWSQLHKAIARAIAKIEDPDRRKVAESYHEKIRKSEIFDPLIEYMIGAGLLEIFTRVEFVSKFPTIGKLALGLKQEATYLGQKGAFDAAADMAIGFLPVIVETVTSLLRKAGASEDEINAVAQLGNAKSGSELVAAVMEPAAAAPKAKTMTASVSR
jgi:hypothetical protein